MSKTAKLRNARVDGRTATPATAGHKHIIRPPRIYSYVDAVAHYGSIRRAADALFIASSALNRRILSLEEEMGTTLFERLPRGVRLTAAGELFIDYVHRNLSSLELVGSQIEHLLGFVPWHVPFAGAASLAGALSPHSIAHFPLNPPAQ